MFQGILQIYIVHILKYIFNSFEFFWFGNLQIFVNFIRELCSFKIPEQERKNFQVHIAWDFSTFMPYSNS